MKAWLARDGRQRGAFIQAARVIVDVHREQARSYSVRVGHKFVPANNPCGSGLARDKLQHGALIQVARAISIASKLAPTPADQPDPTPDSPTTPPMKSSAESPTPDYISDLRG